MSGLEIVDVSVAYGGHKAVSNVSLQAPLGRVTGLIGPNGAGKTTTFNACSGLLRPTTGTVRLNDHDITHRSPAARAQLGLGRTSDFDARPDERDASHEHERDSFGRHDVVPPVTAQAHAWASCASVHTRDLPRTRHI